MLKRLSFVIFAIALVILSGCDVGPGEKGSLKKDVPNSPGGKAGNGAKMQSQD